MYLYDFSPILVMHNASAAFSSERVFVPSLVARLFDHERPKEEKEREGGRTGVAYYLFAALEIYYGYDRDAEGGVT